jgi:hypothetical protein
MSADADRIVNNLWTSRDVLRDDGLSCGDYLKLGQIEDNLGDLGSVS